MEEREREKRKEREKEKVRETDRERETELEEETILLWHSIHRSVISTLNVRFFDLLISSDMFICSSSSVSYFR